MTAEECRRILGVAADARPEAIRQAYIDLARVWHPDRFQADERLRRIAEEHLQQVNQAYAALKNRGPFEAAAGAARTGAQRSTGTASAAATEDPPYAPPKPQPAWTPRRPATPFRKPRLPYAAGRIAMVAALAAAPFFAALKVVPLLRVPVFDSDLAAAHAFQPRILTPMSSIDASSDLRTAADALTEWAHGDAVDLWKPAGTDTPRTQPASVSTASGPTASAMPARTRPVRKQPVAPPPANGAELLPAGRGGAGELGLSNHSDLEAIVELVNRGRGTTRAVYIAPNSSATIHSIGIGVYDLYVDLGHELDAEHLRFGTSRSTPAPLGPFRFAEITSDTGVSGNRYDVVLNPR
jgi:hypothetical protein